MKKSFQERLLAAKRAGNLTNSDLARWFGRSHSTVRTWVEAGCVPRGGPMDIEQVHNMLDLLEKLIGKKQGFPIPQLIGNKRIEHLLSIRKRYA